MAHCLTLSLYSLFSFNASCSSTSVCASLSAHLGFKLLCISPPKVPTSISLIRTPFLSVCMSMALINNFKFHFQRLIALGYLLALVSSSYAMYQAYPDWNSEFIVDLNLFLSKVLWALPVCWVIFACVCGYGGKLIMHLSHRRNNYTMGWSIIIQTKRDSKAHLNSNYKSGSNVTILSQDYKSE